MRLAAAPVTVEQFTAQTYSDDEYWRQRIPFTDPARYYTTRDGDTGNRCHAAYDINDIYGNRDLFAAFAGECRYRWDAYLGLVTILIEPQTGEGLWYCHQANRYVGNKVRVKAGARIGRMGQSGQASGVHLHLPAFRQWDNYSTVFNYGSLLRTLRIVLLDPTAEEANDVLIQIEGSAAVYVVNGGHREEVVGGMGPSGDVFRALGYKPEQVKKVSKTDPLAKLPLFADVIPFSFRDAADHIVDPAQANPQFHTPSA